MEEDIMMGPEAPQVQIKLFTKQIRNAVEDTPFTISSSATGEDLNKVVNLLLKEYRFTRERRLQFDFLVSGELLRLTLKEHLEERNISTETTVLVEYFERTPAPEPQTSILHDDWVSGVHCTDKWILSGCYDNSVSVSTIQGTLVARCKHHSNIVKKVAWIDRNDPSRGFVSVSHDLTAIFWKWEVGTTVIQPQIILRGHTKGVDSVGVSPNSQNIATGGWDTHLKIWAVPLGDDAEPVQKKSKATKEIDWKTPLHTLEGHKENISWIEWIDNSQICSVSMDHTIKFWDAELKGIKNEIVGQKAFLSACWSPLANTLLTSSADRHIRLYDPRTMEGSLVKTTFTSHRGWVSSVKWSNYNEYLFVAGDYTSSVKLWDTRSSRAPLYNLEGHDRQVLSVDWSNRNYIVSGGADNSIHIFKNKHLM